jgi:hypothetical protein
MTTITQDAQIDIHLGEPGRAQLLIDGVDLSNLVYRTEFVIEANHVGRLVLHCRTKNLRIHGAGDVVTIPPLRSIFDAAEPESQA